MRLAIHLLLYLAGLRLCLLGWQRWNSKRGSIGRLLKLLRDLRRHNLGSRIPLTLRALQTVLLAIEIISWTTMRMLRVQHQVWTFSHACAALRSSILERGLIFGCPYTWTSTCLIIDLCSSYLLLTINSFFHLLRSLLLGDYLQSLMWLISSVCRPLSRLNAGHLIIAPVSSSRLLFVLAQDLSGLILGGPQIRLIHGGLVGESSDRDIGGVRRRRTLRHNPLTSYHSIITCLRLLRQHLLILGHL